MEYLQTSSSELKEYYTENPIEFIQDICGVKLCEYQKILIHRYLKLLKENKDIN